MTSSYFFFASKHVNDQVPFVGSTPLRQERIAADPDPAEHTEHGLD
jgi:hypothetical protein